MGKPTDIQGIHDAFKIGKSKFEVEPTPAEYTTENAKPVVELPTAADAPVQSGAKAVFDFNEATIGQFEQQAKEAVAAERAKDEQLRQNFNQESSIDVSAARIIDTVNNTIILAQREAMRSQDTEVLNTLIKAIDSGRQMLDSITEYRKLDKKLEMAKQLEEYKHKLAMEKMEKKAALAPAKAQQQIGTGTGQPLIGGSGPVQVNFNFQDSEALRQQLVGKSLEELNALQSNIGMTAPVIEYMEPDAVDVQSERKDSEKA